MQKTIGTGWLVAAGVGAVLVIAIVFFLADRPRPLHAGKSAQSSGRPLPAQPFVPKAEQ